MILIFTEFQNKVFEFNENVYEGVWDQEIYYQLESFVYKIEYNTTFTPSFYYS